MNGGHVVARSYNSVRVESQNYVTTAPARTESVTAPVRYREVESTYIAEPEVIYYAN